MNPSSTPFYPSANNTTVFSTSKSWEGLHSFRIQVVHDPKNQQVIIQRASQSFFQRLFGSSKETINDLVRIEKCEDLDQETAKNLVETYNRLHKEKDSLKQAIQNTLQQLKAQGVKHPTTIPTTPPTPAPQLPRVDTDARKAIVDKLNKKLEEEKLQLQNITKELAEYPPLAAALAKVQQVALYTFQKIDQLAQHVEDQGVSESKFQQQAEVVDTQSIKQLHDDVQAVIEEEKQCKNVIQLKTYLESLSPFIKTHEWLERISQWEKDTVQAGKVGSFQEIRKKTEELENLMREIILGCKSEVALSTIEQCRTSEQLLQSIDKESTTSLRDLSEQLLSLRRAQWIELHNQVSSQDMATLKDLLALIDQQKKVDQDLATLLKTPLERPHWSHTVWTPLTSAWQRLFPTSNEYREVAQVSFVSRLACSYRDQTSNEEVKKLLMKASQQLTEALIERVQERYSDVFSTEESSSAILQQGKELIARIKTVSSGLLLSQSEVEQIFGSLETLQKIVLLRKHYVDQCSEKGKQINKWSGQEKLEGEEALVKALQALDDLNEYLNTHTVSAERNQAPLVTYAEGVLKESGGRLNNLISSTLSERELRTLNEQAFSQWIEDSFQQIEEAEKLRAFFSDDQQGTEILNAYRQLLEVARQQATTRFNALEKSETVKNEVMGEVKTSIAFKTFNLFIEETRLRAQVDQEIRKELTGHLVEGEELKAKLGTICSKDQENQEALVIFKDLGENLKLHNTVLEKEGVLTKEKSGLWQPKVFALLVSEAKRIIEQDEVASRATLEKKERLKAVVTIHQERLQKIDQSITQLDPKEQKACESLKERYLKELENGQQQFTHSHLLTDKKVATIDASLSLVERELKKEVERCQGVSERRRQIRDVLENLCKEREIQLIELQRTEFPPALEQKKEKLVAAFTKEIEEIRKQDEFEVYPLRVPASALSSWKTAVIGTAAILTAGLTGAAYALNPTRTIQAIQLPDESISLWSVWSTYVSQWNFPSSAELSSSITEISPNATSTMDVAASLGRIDAFPPSGWTALAGGVVALGIGGVLAYWRGKGKEPVTETQEDLEKAVRNQINKKTRLESSGLSSLVELKQVDEETRKTLMEDLAKATQIVMELDSQIAQLEKEADPCKESRKVLQDEIDFLQITLTNTQSLLTEENAKEWQKKLDQKITALRNVIATQQKIHVEREEIRTGLSCLAEQYEAKIEELESLSKTISGQDQVECESAIQTYHAAVEKIKAWDEFAKHSGKVDYPAGRVAKRIVQVAALAGVGAGVWSHWGSISGAANHVIQNISTAIEQGTWGHLATAAGSGATAAAAQAVSSARPWVRRGKMLLTGAAVATAAYALYQTGTQSLPEASREEWFAYPRYVFSNLSQAFSGYLNSEKSLADKAWEIAPELVASGGWMLSKMVPTKQTKPLGAYDKAREILEEATAPLDELLTREKEKATIRKEITDRVDAFSKSIENQKLKFSTIRDRFAVDMNTELNRLDSLLEKGKTWRGEAKSSSGEAIPLEALSKDQLLDHLKTVKAAIKKKVIATPEESALLSTVSQYDTAKKALVERIESLQSGSGEQISSTQDLAKLQFKEASDLEEALKGVEAVEAKTTLRKVQFESIHTLNQHLTQSVKELNRLYTRSKQSGSMSLIEQIKTLEKDLSKFKISPSVAENYRKSLQACKETLFNSLRATVPPSLEETETAIEKLRDIPYVGNRVANAVSKEINEFRKELYTTITDPLLRHHLATCNVDIALSEGYENIEEARSSWDQMVEEGGLATISANLLEEYKKVFDAADATLEASCKGLLEKCNSLIAIGKEWEIYNDRVDQQITEHDKRDQLYSKNILENGRSEIVDRFNGIQIPWQKKEPVKQKKETSYWTWIGGSAAMSIAGGAVIESKFPGTIRSLANQATDVTAYLWSQRDKVVNFVTENAKWLYESSKEHPYVAGGIAAVPVGMMAYKFVARRWKTEAPELIKKRIDPVVTGLGGIGNQMKACLVDLKRYETEATSKAHLSILQQIGEVDEQLVDELKGRFRAAINRKLDEERVSFEEVSSLFKSTIVDYLSVDSKLYKSIEQLSSERTKQLEELNKGLVKPGRFWGSDLKLLQQMDLPEMEQYEQKIDAAFNNFKQKLTTYGEVKELVDVSVIYTSELDKLTQSIESLRSKGEYAQALSLQFKKEELVRKHETCRSEIQKNGARKSEADERALLSKACTTLSSTVRELQTLNSEAALSLTNKISPKDQLKFLIDMEKGLKQGTLEHKLVIEAQDVLKRLVVQDVAEIFLKNKKALLSMKKNLNKLENALLFPKKWVLEAGEAIEGSLKRYGGESGATETVAVDIGRGQTKRLTDCTAEELVTLGFDQIADSFSKQDKDAMAVKYPMEVDKAYSAYVDELETCQELVDQLESQQQFYYANELREAIDSAEQGFQAVKQQLSQKLATRPSILPIYGKDSREADICTDWCKTTLSPFSTEHKRLLEAKRSSLGGAPTLDLSDQLSLLPTTKQPRVVGLAAVKLKEKIQDEIRHVDSYRKQLEGVVKVVGRVQCLQTLDQQLKDNREKLLKLSASNVLKVEDLTQIDKNLKQITQEIKRSKLDLDRLVRREKEYTGLVDYLTKLTKNTASYEKIQQYRQVAGGVQAKLQEKVSTENVKGNIGRLDEVMEKFIQEKYREINGIRGIKDATFGEILSDPHANPLSQNMARAKFLQWVAGEVDEASSQWDDIIYSLGLVSDSLRSMSGISPVLVDNWDKWYTKVEAQIHNEKIMLEVISQGASSADGRITRLSELSPASVAQYETYVESVTARAKSLQKQMGLPYILTKLKHVSSPRAQLFISEALKLTHTLEGEDLTVGGEFFNWILSFAGNQSSHGILSIFSKDFSHLERKGAISEVNTFYQSYIQRVRACEQALSEIEIEIEEDPIFSKINEAKRMLQKFYLEFSGSGNAIITGEAILEQLWGICKAVAWCECKIANRRMFDNTSKQPPIPESRVAETIEIESETVNQPNRPMEALARYLRQYRLFEERMNQLWGLNQPLFQLYQDRIKLLRESCQRVINSKVLDDLSPYESEFKEEHDNYQLLKGVDLDENKQIIDACLQRNDLDPLINQCRKNIIKESLDGIAKDVFGAGEVHKPNAYQAVIIELQKACSQEYSLYTETKGFLEEWKILDLQSRKDVVDTLIDCYYTRGRRGYNKKPNVPNIREIMRQADISRYY